MQTRARDWIWSRFAASHQIQVQNERKKARKREENPWRIFALYHRCRIIKWNNNEIYTGDARNRATSDVKCTRVSLMTDRKRKRKGRWPATSHRPLYIFYTRASRELAVRYVFLDIHSNSIEMWNPFIDSIYMNIGHFVWDDVDWKSKCVLNYWLCSTLMILLQRDTVRYVFVLNNCRDQNVVC